MAGNRHIIADNGVSPDFYKEDNSSKLFHYPTISQVYQQAVDAMADPELLTNFGSFLFNRGHTQRAEALYREALGADPNFLVAKDR